MPRNPFKTRCSVPGCKAWAIRGSDPPICSPHRSRAGSPGQGARPEPPSPDARREPGQAAYFELTRAAHPEPSTEVRPEPSRGASPEPGWYACPEPSRGASPELGWDACPEPSRGASPELGWDDCPEPSRGASPELGWDDCPEPSRAASPELGWDACAEPERGASPELGWDACAEPERGACAERKRGVGAPPGNQNHFIHGFYATALPPDEQARLLAPEGITSLDAEIALTRAALDRIYGMLTTGMTPGPDPQPLNAQDYARLIGLAFRGSNTVARLLSTRMALGGTPTDAFSVTMDKVLDELGEKWGIDL